MGFGCVCCVRTKYSYKNWILAETLRGLFEFLLFSFFVCSWSIFRREIRQLLAWQGINYMQKTLFVLVIKMQIIKSLLSVEHWIWFDNNLKVRNTGTHHTYAEHKWRVTSDEYDWRRLMVPRPITTTNILFSSQIHVMKSLNKLIQQLNHYAVILKHSHILMPQTCPFPMNQLIYKSSPFTVLSTQLTAHCCMKQWSNEYSNKKILRKKKTLCCCLLKNNMIWNQDKKKHHLEKAIKMRLCRNLNRMTRTTY